MEKRIGVFDSGVGGLTILKALVDFMPNEKFYYFGDTKNVPYGTKTPEEIAELSVEAYKKLKSLGIKFLVIGCNTASIHGLKAIEEIADIPVVGVIGPGVIAAREKGLKKILILATDATIDSGVLQSLLKENNEGVKVEGIGSPDMVMAVENGNSHNEEGRKATYKYLDMASIEPDCVLLSCTHFPALTKFVADYFEEKGRSVCILSPADKCAEIAKNALEKLGQLNEIGELEIDYFCSGDLRKFEDSGNILLDGDLVVREVKSL